ncbi:hypothetical protein TRFO_04170 [Tritrichomonas foetus]|uniref:E2F/DP family winged-helix DNA-binding domain-containing protein n=1 Tax=Tritrichomonas foetus TaxID=1144522 RepID=A0A1J4KH39_9EUKA|nr:hypothetical protein TRFO_04170 [Tritrichomonas foetus]|eukprot:OHT10665.1 hypothetical protein TRFO_04170 [Tritrichomonas foetus]
MKKSIQRQEINTVNSDNTNSIFADLVASFEDNKIHNISIHDLSTKCNIQKRSVYNFFSVLIQFGACRNEGKGQIVWISLSNIKKYINQQYKQLEIDSLSKGFYELFDLGVSPSLGTIAIKIITMFMFFGVHRMTKKSMCNFFTRNINDPQSLERRLYLTLNILCVFNIVTRTDYVGEYMLLFEYADYSKKVFSKRLEAARNIEKHFIEYHLKDYPQNYMNILRKRRYKEFIARFGE